MQTTYTIYINGIASKNTPTESWAHAMALVEIYAKSGARVWIEDNSGKVYE